MKASDFRACEVVLFPKVNKDGATDVVVVTVLDFPLFAMLLKPIMLAAVAVIAVVVVRSCDNCVVVGANNVVPV